jgi:hypothetical protein
LQTPTDTLRSLTPDQWRSAYYNIYVYVKADEGAFAIHAADGALIASMPTREAAFAAARLNDLEPLSLH